jgi:uncharacterized protein (DUF885 family)
MKRFLKLGACLVWAAGVAVANPAFDQWAEEFTREWVRANPANATSTQYLPPEEQDAVDRELELAGTDGIPLDPTQRARHLARARRGLEELERFTRAELTPVQRTSAAFLRQRLSATLRSAEFSDNTYLFDQFRGVHIGLVAFLTQTHPMRTTRDLENYLARLERVAPLLDVAIEASERQVKQDVIPPRFIVAATIAGVDRLLAPPVEKNVFVDTLAQAAGKIEGLEASKRDALVTRARTVVSERVRPAFERVRAHLQAQLPRATEDSGIWKLPRGEAMYAAALEAFTTTRLTADEIHAIGLREVARIEGEMDRLLRELGYTTGTVAARYAQLQAAVLPTGTEDPRPAMIEEITRIVRDAETRAKALFLTQPKSPIEVRREPAFTEAGAAARYTQPAPDGSRPGIYWIPLARITPDVIWIGAGTRSVAYHEAVPGHHFQIALQQESTELPRFRKLMPYGVISAHVEGWALYAERIADEAGWFAGDLQGRLGYLAFQLLRARRLVVDTGLHAKRWTRQQALDYGIQASEVDRYIVWPGQACSYMVGQLRILELREKAKAALGSKFSLPRFHDVVLRAGMLPLDVLGEVVDEWVARER